MNELNGPMATVVTSLQNDQDAERDHNAQLRRALAASDERLASMQNAITALVKVYGPELLVGDESSLNSGSGDVEAGQLGLAAASGAVEGEKPARLKSTALVTQVVRESDRPLRRQEVNDQFHERGWVPASWGFPKQAISNAIKRALVKGLIVETEAGLLTPPDSPLGINIPTASGGATV